MRKQLRSIVVIVGALVIVVGCSGGGAASATPGGGATGGTQPSGPAASQPSAAASSGPTAGSGGGLPVDPCALVTADDVTSIYGGTVNSMGLQDGYCRFEITGKANAGTSAAGGEFSVNFGDEWSPYEEAKVVFGDSLVKIEGLGTEAYSWGGFIHAKVGSGEIVVGGVWVGDYDRSLLEKETYDMTKLLLSRT